MAKTLVEVLQESDIKLIESSNGRYVAHCPFHKGDRSPSFTVYPNNSYYCFGCEVWGDPVKFLVEYKGMTPYQAREYVGQEAYFPKRENKSIKVKNMSKTGKFLYETAQIYHEFLMEEKGPQKYILDRGLTLETAKRFLIGYTDGAVINFKFAEEYDIANEIGLLTKNGSERLTHRITIPNIIDNKYCDFMTGRTVLNVKPKYLGLTMSKPLCGFYDSRNSPLLFLVEGNFDYLLLRQWGYPAIVMSGSHITKSNYALLREKLVVIVPDNDEVGFSAAQSVKDTLASTIVLDYRHLGAKDIGELALKTDGQKRFEQVVLEQLWDRTLSQKPTYRKFMPTSLGLTQSGWT